MQVRPSKPTFFARVNIGRAKIEALLRRLMVKLLRDGGEIEIVPDDALHEHLVQLSGPLALVHASLDDFFALFVLAP